MSKVHSVLEEVCKQLAIELNVQYPPGHMAQCDERYYALRKALLLKDEEINLHPVVFQVTEMIAKDILKRSDHTQCSKCNSVYILDNTCPVCNNP